MTRGSDQSHRPAGSVRRLPCNTWTAQASKPYVRLASPACQAVDYCPHPANGLAEGSDRPQRKKHRTRRAKALAVIRGEPTAIHYLVAAVIYGLTPWLVAWVQHLPLPHDEMFSAVVYLMSGGRSQTGWPTPPLVTIAEWINFVGATALLASALLPPVRRFARVHAVAGRFYKYAIALPVWTLLVANLDRFIANEVHSFARLAWYDMTRVFAKVEGPLIAWLQHAIGGPGVSTFASTFDSIVWLAPVALAGGLLVAVDRGRALNSLIVVYVLAGVLAVPLFVLLPAFEPWTTNATYGADALATNIRYLYANASISTLTRINTEFHSAAGSAFPSLHVAVLLVGALVLRRHRFRTASLILFGMAATTALVGVYLGRHWLVDSLAAIPFSLAVVALGQRIPLDLSLKLRSTAHPVLRPGEIAVVDPRDDELRWLFSGFFSRRLRSMSRDAWRSTRVAAARARVSVMSFRSFKSSKRRQRRRRYRSE